LRERKKINNPQEEFSPIFCKKNLPQNKIGKEAEQLAVNFLINKGYKILGQNFRPKWKKGISRPEIDIIATKDDIIVFVEVKALRVDSLDETEFFPQDKVNFYKLKQIKKAIEFFLLENNLSLTEQKCQIDILSILIQTHSNRITIKHLENV
jgi:putative endonuclease